MKRDLGIKSRKSTEKHLPWSYIFSCFSLILFLNLSSFIRNLLEIILLENFFKLLAKPLGLVMLSDYPLGILLLSNFCRTICKVNIVNNYLLFNIWIISSNKSFQSGSQGGKVVRSWNSIPATRVRLPPRYLPQKNHHLMCLNNDFSVASRT